MDSTNTQIRIRLYGIDCPKSEQDFGNVANIDKEKTLTLKTNTYQYNIMIKKHLQVVIIFFIGTLSAYSQSDLENIERIKEYNSKLMENLSEGAYTDFAQKIKLITNIANNCRFC